VYWTRKNEAENAEFSKITSRKQNLKAARNEKLSSRRSANSPMPSGCAIPILKPGVFQQNRDLELLWSLGFGAWCFAQRRLKNGDAPIPVVRRIFSVHFPEDLIRIPPRRYQIQPGAGLCLARAGIVRPRMGTTAGTRLDKPGEPKHVEPRRL